MSAMGWMWLRRLSRSGLTWESRPRTHSQRKRKTIPGVEPLEAMALLSTGSSLMSGAAVHLHHSSKDRLVSHAINPPVSYTADMSSDQAPVTPAAQTVSIGKTLTNFTNLPLSPALNLFNPSLGTLLSVEVSHSATIQSNITSTNLSTSSSTVITATFSGSYQIDGLNQPISQPTKTLTSQPMPAGVFGSGTDTVTFPPLVLTDSSTTTFTDPGSLAFFTSSSGRSAITLTMNATAAATASAPNGNLLTTTESSASATVTVSLHVPPGVSERGWYRPDRRAPSGHAAHRHLRRPRRRDQSREPRRLFGYHAVGQNDPHQVGDLQSGHKFGDTDTRRLNVHHHFRLSLVIPCPNEQTGETVVIPFGGKRSLIGFYNHRGQFIPVHNGKIERSQR